SFTIAPAAVEVAAQCSDGKDNDGDGKIDAADPGCHSDNDPTNPASFDPNDNDETDAAAPSPSPPDPVDDSDTEGSDDDAGGGDAGGGGGGGGGGQGTDAGSLPFTGSDVVGLSLAGLLMLAGGLLLRRREGLHAL
ncbi:MAG: LPXTG cell wall anchor domain-containing protein, partial [Solirubrobacteraceae bacterium]